jgi:mono/diheme cytochrome c family protein
VLGVSARQLGRAFGYASGEARQLTTWSRIGMFRERLDESNLASLPRLSPLDDRSASLEQRARSYLDANCSPCHNPGGVQALFDARYATPLAEQKLIDGAVLNPLGMEQPRVIAPGDPARSLLYFRLYSVGEIGMPPVAKQRVDQQAAELFREWITALRSPQ